MSICRASTCWLSIDPHPSLFQHRPCPYDQNQEPKERVHSHLWTLETLSLYLRQLRVLVLKCTSTVRTIKFHFYVYK